jgi:hypothetical protein
MCCRCVDRNNEIIVSVKIRIIVIKFLIDSTINIDGSSMQGLGELK